MGEVFYVLKNIYHCSSLNECICCTHKEWWYRNIRHRDNDLPAVIWGHTYEWYQYDKRHRDNDKPAIIVYEDPAPHAEVCGSSTIYGTSHIKFINYIESHASSQHHDCNEQITSSKVKQSSCVWYKEGKIHRENDQPAFISRSGSKAWFINNMPHRENDRPAIIHENGTMVWYYNGKVHRENDQPAVIFNNGHYQYGYKGYRVFNYGSICRIFIRRGIDIMILFKICTKPLKDLLSYLKDILV